MSKQDNMSTTDLCKNCKSQPCCTDFAAPLVFPKDLEQLKKIGKPIGDFLISKTVAGHQINEIIKKKNSSHCYFWDDKNNNCSIYDNRPFECKMFPFDIFLIENEFHWVVFSCNPDSDWQWTEDFLEKLENDPQFDEIKEKMIIIAENPITESEEIPYVVLRKVKT